MYLVGGVSPEVGAHFVVKQLGECLGKTIGNGLHHDALVVVVLGAQLGANLLDAEAARNSEAADVVLI